jgi:cbb3-type cytochrome oxidase maturation protein
MKDYFFLIPIALGLGLSALAAFMWSLKTRQYDDLEGAAVRILHEEDVPIRTKSDRQHPDHRPNAAAVGAYSNESSSRQAG